MTADPESALGRPRLLLVRTSALGDVVHALPVLSALRRRYPRGHIGWVVEEAFAPLLAGHPDLDEAIPVRARVWRRRALHPSTLREVAHLVSRLQDFGADAVIDLMGNHKAAALAALTDCDRRIGARRRDRREPSSAAWINEPVAVRGVHAVERGLSLLEAVDAVPADVDFGPDRILPAAHPAEVPPLLIQPAAGWPNKQYPAASWGRVIAELRSQTGLAAGVLAGPGEHGVARAVADAAGGEVEIVEPGPLRFLVAALRGARLVLGGDTGPVHLAHALGTGVLCVLGPTDPLRSGPYGAPERALWHELPCSFCYQRLPETKACLLQVAPGAVVQRAATLLEAGA